MTMYFAVGISRPWGVGTVMYPQLTNSEYTVKRRCPLYLCCYG